MLRVAEGSFAVSVNRCGEPLSKELARALADDLFHTKPGWYRFILTEQEISGRLPGRDAIELLAGNAVLAECALALNREPGTLGPWEEGIALRSRRADPPDLLVWHERDVIALRLNGEGPRVLEIGYEPDLMATPLSRIVADKRAAFPARNQRAYFEWRGYYGTGSRPEDGLAGFVRKAGKTVARIVVDGPGLVIGTVLRVCRVPGRLPELNGERVFKLLRKLGDQRWTDDRGVRPVDLVREASRRRRVTDPCALVLVHGGLSSSGAAFEKLDFRKLGLAGCSVYVFEHDTCRRVIDNADELATCAAKLLANCSRVLLLAHSRGGLVAREAVSMLPSKLPAGAPLRRGDIEIITCGAPHLGTPILRDAAALINALCVAAGFLHEVPCVDPTLGVLAYLAGGLEKLPPGLEDVAPDSALIKRLKHLPTLATTSFAGVSGDALSDNGYRPNTFERLRYRLVRGIAEKLLRGGHDAVVPTDSAKAAGTGIVLKDCSHWGYFARNETLLQLQRWLVDCETRR